MSLTIKMLLPGYGQASRVNHFADDVYQPLALE